MDPISILAASGLRARMESLDMLANNLANTGTNGFKNDVEFYTLFTNESSDAADLGVPTTQPMLDRHWTDFSQGLLQPTNNALDLALDGKGFFTVTGPSGPLYTRNGSFKVSPQGDLVTADGYPLTELAGGKIQLDPALPVQVAPDGTVQQGGQAVGQLQIVDFPDRTPLMKQGNNYYLNVNPDVKPQPVPDTEVKQGAVETSNVKAPESAVHLIGILRQFEMLQKAINIAGDMNKQSIEQVAKVGQ
jgi:flagellar basal body rod protein FlgG